MRYLMLSHEEIAIIRDYFADKISYQFKQEKLLIQALTRPSALGICLPKDSENFEPLEFIGDRVLNLAIAEQLYQLNPKSTPHELHNNYMALIRNSDDSKKNGGPLYRVAKEINIEYFIIKSLQEDLARYGNRGKRLDIRRKTKEGILADHVEALVGAMYLDCHQDMKVITQFVRQFWSQLGLNEDGLSESSFGRSTNNMIANLPNNFQQIRQNNIMLSSAKLGNWPQAQLAINNGANPSAVDDAGLTALHYFAGWGNLRAISSLLEMHVEIDALDLRGCTPIMHAAASGFPAFELLSNEGASIDSEVVIEGNIITALSVAASNGHSAIVRKILLEYSHLFNSEQIDSAYTQAKKNNRQDIQDLIDKAGEQHKKNLLLFAALKEWLADNNKKTWAALTNSIMRGADVRARNAEQQSIFHLLATSRARFRVINYIFQKRPVLDRLDLSGASSQLFLPTNALSDPLPCAQASEEWIGLSLKHSNLTGISLLYIKTLTDVDFSHSILTEVEFHPEAKFINCNFTGAVQVGTKINTHNMDTNTKQTFSRQTKTANINQLITEPHFFENSQPNASISKEIISQSLQNKIADNSASFWCSRRVVATALAAGGASILAASASMLAASGASIALRFIKRKP